MATERNEIVTVLTVSADPAIAKAREFAAALDENLRAVERNVAGNAKLGTALDNSVKVSARQKRALDDVLTSMDPTYAAHQKLAAETEKLALASRGLVSQSTAVGKSNEYLTSASAVLAERQKQLNQIQSELSRGMITGNQALERISAGMGNAAGSTKLTAQQMAALAPQVNDVITQLASGTPVFQVVAQQGGQITQAIGGMGNAFRLVASPAGAAAVAIGAVGAAAALVGARMLQMNDETRRLTALTQSLNPQLGATAEQLRQISFAVAERGVSRSEGMAAVEAVIRNTRIQSAALAETIAKLSVDLSAIQGGKPEEWAVKLADAAAGGAQGFSRLLDVLPGIRSETLAAARAAEMQGDRLGAVNLALADLEKRYGGSAKAMKSEFGSAVDDMMKKFDQLVEHMAMATKPFAQAGAAALGQVFQGVDWWVNGKPQNVQNADAMADVERRLKTSMTVLGQLTEEGAPAERLAQLRKQVADLQTQYYGLAAAANDAGKATAAVGGSGGGAGAGAANGAPGGTPPSGSIVGLNDQDKDKLNLATEAMTRQAQGARLLADNLSVTARASAENRVALAEMAMQYPGLGAKTAEAILTSKDFGATLKTLPPELQNVFRSMEQNSANKLAGDLAMATVGLTSEANAARLAAEAAGLGEAAMRQASIEAEVYAHRMDGTAEAVRAAREQQEQFVRQQIRNDFSRGIDLQVAANDRLVVAMRQGVAETRNAEIYNKAVAQAMRETVPQYDAAGNATGKFSQAIAENVVKLKEQQQSADKVDLSNYSKQLDNARRALVFQQKTVGMSAEAKAVAKAEFDTLEYARQRYGEYEKLTDAQRQEVDALVNAARQNAVLEQSVQRQQSAWTELTGTLEKAFDRLGDALVQAFVAGKGEAVNWGNVTRAIISSIAADLIKMAAIRPFTNMVFGQSQPTFWDAFSGNGVAANQNGAAGGGMGGTSNLLSAGSNLYSSATGTNTLGTFATSPMGYSLGLSSNAVAPGTGIAAGYVDTIGASQITNGMTLSSSGQALSAIGSAAPYGMIGGIGGAYIANNFANGNRVVGGLSGAALGVGTMAAGTAAMGAMGMGAAAAGMSGMAGASAALMAIPVYGWIAAAVLAAVTAIMGSRGKAPIPYGGAWVNTDSTGVVTDRAAGAENGVDQKALEQRVDAINSVMSGLAQAGGFTYGGINLASEYQGGKNGKGNRTLIGGWGGTLVSTSDDPARIGLDALRYLRDNGQLTGGSDLSKRVLDKAIADGKSDTIGDAIKAVGLAKSITESTTALSEFDKSLQGVALRAKKAQADALKPFLEELEIAGKYDIKPEYAAMAKQQFTSMIEDLRDPKQYTQVEIDMATLRGTFGELHEAAARLDPALASLVDTMGAEAIAVRAANQNKALNVQLAEALGHGFINQINDVLENEQISARNLTALGQPITRAQEIRAAQLDNILKGLTGDQLDFVTATYGATSDIGKLAQTIKALGSAGGDVTKIEQSIAQIRIDNANETIKLLQEQQQTAQQAKSTWEGLVRSVSATRLGLLTDSNLSPLSPEARMNEALRQYRETLAKAQGGDATAAGDVQNLAKTALEAAKAFYASSPDYAKIFTEVQDGLGGVESVAARQLTAANATLSTLQQSLNTQQGILNALNKPTATGDVNSILSGLNAGNLSDIFQWAQRSGDAGLVQRVLETADSRLGWQANPYRYKASDAVSALASGFGESDYMQIGQSIGFGGTYAQLNPWIAAFGKQSAFEDAVRAYAANRPTRVVDTNPAPEPKPIIDLTPQERERRYLAANPDVAAAVAAGAFASGQEHWERYGQAEGRAYQNGGIVGNGVWGMDSVLARYAGGGEIALAGGEGVLTAAATAAIGGAGAIDYINRTGRLPANDRWGGNVMEYRRPAQAGGGGDAAGEVRQLRTEVERLHKTIDRMAAMLGDQGAEQIDQLAGIRTNTKSDTGRRFVA
ncbi:phage tail length tape measure family protein [Azospirillum sp.]|uniref:phage tail length tape measure family protein n=1 Tax=Azospirillum sp. TaxID=34012 RepID=UPI003D7630B8